MHQRVGEFAVVGEQQQAGGLVVQPADGDPASAAQGRQIVEHRRALAGVVAGDDHSGALVRHQQARNGRLRAAQLAAIDGDFVVRLNALAHMGGATVHRHPARGDPALHFAPRAQAAIGQRLVQFLRHALPGRGVAA